VLVLGGLVTDGGVLVLGGVVTAGGVLVLGGVVTAGGVLDTLGGGVVARVVVTGGALVFAGATDGTLVCDVVTVRGTACPVGDAAADVGAAAFTATPLLRAGALPGRDVETRKDVAAEAERADIDRDDAATANELAGVTRSAANTGLLSPGSDPGPVVSGARAVCTGAVAAGSARGAGWVSGSRCMKPIGVSTTSAPIPPPIRIWAQRGVVTPGA
jgi:hypothetical protein